jgi:hypothetical protein
MSVGLLICLIGYALGLAGCLGAVASTSGGTIDPEGVGGAEFLAIIIALGTLSALFGTRKHQPWLSKNLKGAAFSGIVAGVLTGAALFAFGAVTARGDNPLVGVLLFVVRFTFIVWPAFILNVTIAVVRRRALGHAGTDPV